MMQPIATDNTTAVIGLGITGRSCVRYLRERGRSVAAFDSELSDEQAEAFRREFPDIPLHLGEFQVDRLQQYRNLMVSPGISLEQSAVKAAIAAGSNLISDIDLLLAEIDIPVIAITGSNGKTTVTTLVGEMVAAAGLCPAVGGNIGVPVLDLLDDGTPYDVFVLELSSFQLERCGDLGARVAALLNVSPDHMDRHGNLPAYQRVKQGIYRGCRWAIHNRDDRLSSPLLNQLQKHISFGLGKPDLGQFGLIEEAGDEYLARGNEKLMSCGEMQQYGRHNQLNALAALAIGTAFGLDVTAMLAALRSFLGMPHRCEWVGEYGGVQFFNDSKGTNVGATLAALNGLSRRAGDIVLIAGGRGKGADFTPLRQAQAALKGVVLLGEDAAIIGRVFELDVRRFEVADMASAVAAAVDMAEPGDMVLLSPACSSLDMYRNFEARGDHFSRLVKERFEGVSL